MHRKWSIELFDAQFTLSLVRNKHIANSVLYVGLHISALKNVSQLTLQCPVLWHVFSVSNHQACLQYWQLLDRIVQQVALQTKDGNPDDAPLEIDVLKLIKQLVLTVHL